MQLAALYILTSFASNCKFISAFLSACICICFDFSFEPVVPSYWCQQTILFGSLTFLHVLSRGTDYLCSGLYFQGYLFSKQPWKKENVSLWHKEQFAYGFQRQIVSLWSKGQTCLLSSIKDWGSLSLGFFSCYTTQYFCRYCLPLFVLPWGIGGLRKWCREMLIPWLLQLL